jgi:hypothetical protein
MQEIQEKIEVDQIWSRELRMLHNKKLLSFMQFAYYCWRLKQVGYLAQMGKTRTVHTISRENYQESNHSKDQWIINFSNLKKVDQNDLHLSFWYLCFF